jgi:hypothetical protein
VQYAAHRVFLFLLNQFINRVSPRGVGKLRVKCCGLLTGPRATGSTFRRHHRPRDQQPQFPASRRSKSAGTGCAPALT